MEITQQDIRKLLNQFFDSVLSYLEQGQLETEIIKPAVSLEELEKIFKKKKIKYKLISFINPTLKEKYNNGIKKAKPINLPRNLCIHSHQKIILNSCNVIEKF